MKKLFFFLLLLSIVDIFAMDSEVIKGIHFCRPQDVNFIRLILIENQDFLCHGATLQKRLLATICFMNNEDHVTKLFFVEGEPIGFITFSRIGQCPLCKNYLPVASVDARGRPRKALHGFITYLFVLKEYRRHSFGETLVRDAIQDMKISGAKVIQGDVMIHNVALRLLYEKLAFGRTLPPVVGPTHYSYRLIVE